MFGTFLFFSNGKELMVCGLLWVLNLVIKANILQFLVISFCNKVEVDFNNFDFRSKIWIYVSKIERSNCLQIYILSWCIEVWTEQKTFKVLWKFLIEMANWISQSYTFFISIEIRIKVYNDKSLYLKRKYIFICFRIQ